MSGAEFERVVLITGAGSGIGAALARRIAARRTALMLHARGADNEARQRLAQVANAGHARGHRMSQSNPPQDPETREKS